MIGLITGLAVVIVSVVAFWTVCCLVFKIMFKIADCIF